MMKSILLEPKAQLQRFDETKKEFAKVALSEGFHLVLSLAMAEFVVRGNPTQEEIQGARKFISVLLHMPFEDAPLPDFPVRRINQSALSVEPQIPK